MLVWIWVQVFAVRVLSMLMVHIGFHALFRHPRGICAMRFQVSKARCGFIWRPESLPDGKRLSHPRLDNAGVGSLKDVSRKAFEAARRCKGDNSFKRVYEQSLENTKNAVHARLATQRKILATLRAMWIGNRPQ